MVGSEVGEAAPDRPATAWAGRLAVPPGLEGAARGLLVAGRGCGPPAAVLALAERLGWPVLADPRSGCRVAHPCVVAAGHALARSPEVRRHLRPDVVVVLGEPWASKAVPALLAEAADAGARVVLVDPWWRWADPDRVATEIHRADPAAWLAAALAEAGWPVSAATGPVGGAEAEAGPGAGAAPGSGSGTGVGGAGPGGAGGPGGEGSAAGGGWLAGWQAVERAAQQAVDEVLADDAARRGGVLTEPALARTLLPALPPEASVVVASSMPVRDLEWFAPALAAPPRVLANRGANGIDGVASTALGAAAAGSGPVVGVLGDLAFLHDASALVRPSGPPPAATSCTLVVVDNGGGGIFSFLPQAGALDPSRFEQLFGTPQAPDVAAVARGFGLDVADVGTPDELTAALGAAVGRPGLSVIRARVPDRTANAALHERIQAAVTTAAATALATPLE